MAGIGLPELLVMAVLPCVVTIPFWIYCIIDIVRNDFADNNKMIWLLVVVLLYTLGVVLYFAIGRRQRVVRTSRAPVAGQGL